ncbi:MAG: formimidoylglutamate deiminase [Gammaproteobacteria bacterium]|nr:formimidoylglutamate deiminase [Gammaproteobacteria bacterium]
MVKPDSSIWAQHALTADGWQTDVSVQVDSNGIISEVRANQKRVGDCVGILLPAVANLHSHAFQRAMAGLTESRGPDPKDTFWSWRKLMYSFLQKLTPNDVESIATFGQMQMLEAGYASVGEFHYLHHQSDGSHYGQRAEMSERIISAANQSGIGLTLLPVLYEQGGCDGRALTGGQKRFGNSIDEFEKLYSDAQTMISEQSNQFSIGVAPHSLRAVAPDSIGLAKQLAGAKPFHIHVAEQLAEVEEIQATLNARPVQWLLDNHDLDTTWCLIHATQMLPDETKELARTCATVGLCPITESNLGDGIFNGALYDQCGGSWGIGTDSNVRIALSEELRTLEYTQRLIEHSRAVFAHKNRSCGRVLFDAALAGGVQALQRNSGSISAGRSADLLALDVTSADFTVTKNDQWLDAWIFAGDDRLITDVWSAGVKLVRNGTHVDRSRIVQRYQTTLTSLLAKL